MLSRLISSGIREADDRVDLSESSDFVLGLLDDTRAWRQRVVEELTFDSGVHVRASTAMQIDFPPDLLRHHIDLSTSRCANMLLPIGTRWKHPILGLSIVGHGGAPVHLVTRASIAALEGLYLELLAASSPVAADLEPRLSGALLEAICVFSPDLFRAFLVDAVRQARPDPMETALARYLRSGFGDQLAIDESDVRTWRSRRSEVGQVLTRHLGEQRSVVSSSEEVLLAVPAIDPRPASKEQVTQIVEDYADAVLAADAAGDDALLSVLAEYGRRYELIVETEVPLLEPATITVSENRPLNLRFGRSRQRFALGEGQSAHLEARVADPNVTFGGFDTTQLSGRPARIGPLESARYTAESVSLYSSEPDRPYYIDVVLRLRPRWHLRLTSYVLIALNVAAAAAALTLGTGGDLEARLAFLVVPTTLAATFALVREQTALSIRLLQLSRAGLLVSILALWSIALVQILSA